MFSLFPLAMTETVIFSLLLIPTPSNHDAVSSGDELFIFEYLPLSSIVHVGASFTLSVIRRPLLFNVETDGIVPYAGFLSTLRGSGTRVV